MAFIYIMVVLAAGVFQTGFSEMLYAVPECPLKQYIGIGTMGLVQCSFNESFLAVTWYNVNERRPILLYKDGVKSGDGYHSGEFDIHPNGSLVINNVGVEHESVYSVSKAISASEPTVSYAISVYTTVIPAVTIPAIDPCPYVFDRICVLLTVHQITVTCSIRDSRPAVNLSWEEQTHGSDDILVSNYMNFTKNNVTYTSRATTTFFLEDSNFLALLVCQASSVPLNLMKQENIILIERQIDYISMFTPDKSYVKIHSRMYLSCNDRTLNLLMWKRSRGREADVETMFVSILQQSNLTQLTYKEYQLEVDGSISLQNTLIEHEGLYACLHDNGVSGGIRLHNVSVIVDPMPAFPVVDGCNHQQYCVLEKEPRDQLTCSVLGIRPEVSLEWRAFRQETPIVFTHHVLKVTKEGDGYDVSLTVNFDITITAQDKITVECYAVGENSELFSLSTKVDLLFTNVLFRDRDSNILTIAIIVGALITLTVIISVVLVSMCRKRRARRRKPIGTVNNNIEETIPMMESDTCNSEKAERFIKQLKAKYEMLYDSVQPIPYIKDRMYCVDKVFVEGGIDIMTGISKGKAQWDKLSSYQELVKENCLKTKRQILEGEPGYGKSTLTLQLLYDWCKSLSKSPLRGVDVIIYLRLRQLGGVKSILSAIRRFILPMDSDISEEDIHEILNQLNSVLVLLDGFDEYPDQERTETDIYHIMKKNMFQEFNVILTTRPSCVPQKIAPHSDRVRLTGFGEEARKKYVEKAVIGNGGEAVDKIMRKLHNNPVLDDLCQVPMFFVMFAHITYENENLATFNSVTSFFRYMIASFHSHMINKMKDDNVEKFELMEHEHKELDKVAFEALSGENQTIIWDREQLHNHLGHEFYDQYIRIGILVAEEVLNIADTLHLQSDIQYKNEVRFYHKLFCEWYAAHYVAEQFAGGQIDDIHNFLHNLDPFDLQYVYRFACGLNKIAAEKIIQYLQQNIDCKKFAILCMLEQDDKTDRFIETVSDLVSSSVTTITKDESKLLQRSTLQILDVASKNQVPIACLVLDKGLAGANDEGISLESGFHIPVLLTIEKLEIRLEKGTELTQEVTLGVVSYAQECHNLKNLTFIDCLLPLSFSLKLLSPFMKSKQFQVLWQPLKHEFCLDISKGTWKFGNPQDYLVLTVGDQTSLPQLCFETVYIQETDSKQLQRSTIVLLELASSQNIPITRVYLNKSFKECVEDVIVLHSGLRLNQLLTVDKIHIETEQVDGEPRILTEEEVTMILRYGLRSEHLKELSFSGCTLPLTFSLESLPTGMWSRNIKVCWSLLDGKVVLNGQAGHWEVEDNDSLRHLCSEEVAIKAEDHFLQQWLTIISVQNASNHDIPISSVYLDRCFSRIDESDLNLILQSGLSLSILSSLQKLEIYDNSRRLTNEESAAILSYSSQCTRLKELRFRVNYLPDTIPVGSISSSLNSRNVKVWNSSYHPRRLNLQTGEWQACDVNGTLPAEKGFIEWRQ